MAYIYLIESEYKQEKYKIGFTRNKDVKKRLKQLKVGNPSNLTILEKFKTKHKRKIETALHNIYSIKNVDGEWFELEKYDVDNFIENCSKLEKNFDILKENNNPYY